MNSRVSREAGNRPTPLDELRVVEVSDRIAGSYCGKLLVDAGAQVRKIEPPQGDPLRRYSATCSLLPDGASGPLFSYLNAGKASLSLTPDSDRYRVELATADVVVVTAGRSRAPGLGIDPSRLLADNPRAVIVTISDFGWSGPFADRAATEFTLQAWAGGGGGLGGPARGPPAGEGGGPGG
ncbi:CoA transferase, partial [Mycobacterium riyadhense]